ncbi:alpha/beta fold hydrolase [Roseateles noduli]|uniref:alpha/beta fold hydrolase n=1 Tax=Roseateles noduli TaxID=2052484 RepID=UPI003D64820F
MKAVIASAALATSLLSGAAFAADKPTIVLVHGAFEDASVWTHTQTQLKSDGYKVVTVNLPGHPSNPLAPDKASLDVYRDAVLTVIDAEKAPVVLVGHSFGGITISAVGEARPEKIKSLVYLAAYLPTEGQSLLSLANTDRDSKLGPFVQIQKEKGIASIAYTARADLFANDGPPELRKAIPDLLLDENLAPLATPVHVTPERFGKVDKVYIKTAKDVVVSPYLQTEMIKATPVRLTLSVDTGHTPFLTAPKELAKAIEASAK